MNFNRKHIRYYDIGENKKLWMSGWLSENNESYGVHIWFTLSWYDGYKKGTGLIEQYKRDIIHGVQIKLGN